MLDLKSWRESSHLALIGIKRVVVVGVGEGGGEFELPWLLLMIYCLNCECVLVRARRSKSSQLWLRKILSVGKRQSCKPDVLKQPSQSEN